jgi:hypothetical protein
LRSWASLVDHVAHGVAQALGGARGEADVHQLGGDLLLELHVGLVLVALFLEGRGHLFVEAAQGGEAFQGFGLELDQGGRLGAAAIRLRLLRLRRLRQLRALRFRRALRCFDRVRVDQAVDQFVDAHLVAADLVGGFEDVGNRRRAGGDRLDHVLEAFLDALGDLDFAFAGEEFDRAHLAHVHADGVGGAAEFGIDGGQGLLGFGFGLLVIDHGGGNFGHQQVFSGGGHVEDLDAHVVEGADDRLDLLGVDEVVGQVVVDFGVGQVAPFLAEGDQGLEPRAADFGLFSRGASAIIGASLSLTFAARGLAGALRGVFGLFRGHGCCWSPSCVVRFVIGCLAAARLGRRISRNRKLYYESDALGRVRSFCLCST